MAIPHAKPGEVVPIDWDIPLENPIGTRAVFKTAHMEVLRFELPQGKSISEHRAPGDIMVQCMAGRVIFTAMGKTIELEKGQMFYLCAGELHALHAPENCRFLLTILLDSVKGHRP